MQAPNAPSHNETAADPQKTLDWISARLAEIYSVVPTPGRSIDRAAYSEIYTAIWNYCSAAKEASSSQQIINLRAKQLYSDLEQAIRTHCRDSLARATKSTVSGTLSAYVEQWTNFLRLSRVVTHLSQLLQDRWIQREIAEAKGAAAEGRQRGLQHVFLIPDLHMMIWREEVLTGSAIILDAIVAMQEQEQDPQKHSEESQRTLADSIASLDKVGLALSDGSFVVLH
jgi:hypothetical protein